MLPSEVFRRRMREARESKRREDGRPWRQQDLADALEKMGTPIDRATLGKMETTNGKRRGISLDEALNIAAALEVSPLHLMVPLGDGRGDAVKIGGRKYAARRVRAWIRGERPLPNMRSTLFLAELPDSERKALAESQIDLVRQIAEARRREASDGEH